jgi:hypothetical protein
MEAIQARRAVQFRCQAVRIPEHGIVVTITVTEPDGTERNLEPFWLSAQGVATFSTAMAQAVSIPERPADP